METLDSYFYVKAIYFVCLGIMHWGDLAGIPFK